MQEHTIVVTIVTGALLIMAILLLLSALYFSGKRAKAKAAGNEAEAINYETAERLCAIFSAAMFIGALANLLHSSTINGLSIIIRNLEELAHG